MRVTYDGPTTYIYLKDFEADFWGCPAEILESAERL